MDGDALAELDVILEVGADVLLPQPVYNDVVDLQLVKIAEQEICHGEAGFATRGAGRLAVEGKGAVLVLNVGLVHLTDDVFKAEAEVVLFIDPVDVVGPLPLVTDKGGGRVGATGVVEGAGDGDVGEVVGGVIHIDAELSRVLQLRCVGAVDGEARVGEVQVVDDVLVDDVLLAEGDGLRSLKERGARERMLPGV